MERVIEESKSGRRPQMWVTASGKGGVGKTFVSSSLAISLTKLGHSVIVVDLDPTGANVHTALGQNPADVNLRHWFEGNKSLQEIVTPTPLPRLSFIQGLWDLWSPANISSEQLKRLIPELKSLRADYVIVDLGPGAVETHLELFRAADERIVITSPEPTSIEKTYRFLEAHICWTLKDTARPDVFNALLGTLRDHRNRKMKKPFSFRQYLKENDGFSVDHFESLGEKPIRLIVNSSRSQANIDLGHSIRSVCCKYYDLSLDYLGAIDFDNAVWQSIKNREPVLISQPFTPLAGQFVSICKHLIAPSELRAVG
ncbi:MAG: P-loop NTPase [Bdellovibrionaceae bacterium]|nr:P-loop NTPase [Pseudobdellovibrionaceae bacterium]